MEEQEIGEFAEKKLPMLLGILCVSFRKRTNSEYIIAVGSFDDVCESIHIDDVKASEFKEYELPDLTTLSS